MSPPLASTLSRAASSVPKQKGDDLKKQVEAQKKEVATLQRELDIAQREARLRSAAYYADAGVMLRDQAKFAADAEAYRMITMARAETQMAKINAEPPVAAEDHDQGRRVRLRQRRVGDVAHLEQPAPRHG